MFASGSLSATIKRFGGWVTFGAGGVRRIKFQLVKNSPQACSRFMVSRHHYFPAGAGDSAPRCEFAGSVLM
jgi:hypothetical protein